MKARWRSWGGDTLLQLSLRKRPVLKKKEKGCTSALNHEAERPRLQNITADRWKERLLLRRRRTKRPSTD